MLTEQLQAIELGHFRRVAFRVRDCHPSSGIQPDITFRKVVIRTGAHTPLDSTSETTLQDLHEFSKRELSTILRTD